MGIGRDLGLQLRDWIQNGLDLSGSSALSNRLMDALGAEPALRGPLRDLAAQPLTLRALGLRGAEQQAALQALRQLLSETYSPRVLAELLDLLEAATGMPAAGPAPHAPAPAAVGSPARSPSPAPSRTPPAAPPPRRRDRGHAAMGWRGLLRRQPAWEAELLAIAPGLFVGFTGALVLAWAAAELDRWTFARIGWSSGVALALVLWLLQLLTLLPGLASLRRLWLLDRPSSGDPHRLWAWISAPWIHAVTAEALFNVVLLLILLGPTPLGGGKLVLRYLLTCLACQGAALLVARRRGVDRRWGGAAPAVAALTAMAASLSLLQGQELRFDAGPLSVPAWVLLVVNGGLQLSWQLPRSSADDASRPLERLWCSPWWWGTLGGVLWALITRAGELLAPLLKAAAAG